MNFNNNVPIFNLNIQIRPVPSFQNFPEISKPVPIGTFSINTHRFFANNIKALRYFVPPNFIGFEYLDHLLSFIHDNDLRADSMDMRRRLNANVVCMRNILQLIMSTPYEYQKDWCLLVTHYNGIMYITNQETPSEEADRIERKRSTSWYYKLKQLCMSSSPLHKPESDLPVDECIEFNCVFETRLGEFKLLYAAEMCGIISNTVVNEIDLSRTKFIELKTRLNNMNRHQWRIHNRHETLIWWCQCFLVDIDELYVGYHDENGYLQKIEKLGLRNLRKESEQFWQAAACGQFLLNFLKAVKTIVAETNYPNIIEFNFNAKTAKINYIKHEARSEYSFLPDWYRRGH